MNESKISNEINNSNLARLQNLPGLNILPSDYYGDDIDDKVEMLAVTISDLYLRTKKELKGLFLLNELVGITQAFSGTLVSECNKTYLLTEIEDSIQLDGLDGMFGFDGSTLIDKIKGLTEFQCMTIIGMVTEFKQVTVNSTITDDEAKKLFMIE